MILRVALLVLLWGVVVARLPTLWRDARQRAFWATVFVVAMINTVVAAGLGPPILPNLLGVVAGCLLLRFMSLLTGRGHRRHLTLTVMVLAALVVLAVMAGSIELTGDRSAAKVTYWVVLEGFLGTVLVSTTRLFWPVARKAPAGLPRLGLRAIAVGCAMVAAYAAIKTILIVAMVDIDFAGFEKYAVHLQGGGMLVAVAGACVPAARRSREIMSAYWSLLVLRPLWKAMRDAFPEVILFSPRRAVFELAGVDDVHLRLYRRVIEIRDGMLALRPYLPERPPERADLAQTDPAQTDPAQTDPAQTDPAQTEAAAIAAALRRRAEGATGANEAGFAVVGPEMADEVAWLSRVSRAFRTAARTPRLSGSAR